MAPDALRLEVIADGGERPVLVGQLPRAVEDRIMEVCPGTNVEAPRRLPPNGGGRHDLMWGNALRIVEAHATDPQVRFEATSGGVLSALCMHLLSTEKVDFVLHVAPSREQPVRSGRQLSFDRASVMEGARARYGPAAPLVDFTRLLDEGRPFAFVGKPCDVAAVRNLARIDDRVSKTVPYVLTMVCGGASELGLSLGVLAEFGLREEEIATFRYRGYGNPGLTYIETRDGRSYRKTYNEMWEQGESTWRLQFRCKICPDAIGEQADVVALDTWPGAHPEGEDEGFNAVIARTPAGLQLLNEAEAAGVLTVLGPLDFRQLDSFQPHQVERRQAALARLTAFALHTGLRPSFKGHRLVRAARAAGLQAGRATFGGTIRRLREGQHVATFVRRPNGRSPDPVDTGVEPAVGADEVRPCA
jgi:coenzyme F420 hydrogenase subunit beta